MTYDVINPPHYRAGGIEVIDVIEGYGLTYHTGNAVKYILRAGKKPSVHAVDLSGPSDAHIASGLGQAEAQKSAQAEDYGKALWYLRRALMKPEIHRTSRTKCLNDEVGWYVPLGTPTISAVAGAFELPKGVALGLSGILGQVMYEGEIMDRVIKELIAALELEIGAMKRPAA